MPNMLSEEAKNNSKAERGSRYIFVGGSPRSGTTLLQNMLDSHPDICGIPEFKINYLMLNTRLLIRDFISNNQIDQICTHEEADNHIASFIESFLDPLFDKYQCKLLSEKTPNNILVMTQLIDLFPKAKFLHVVRDPRAVVSSLLEVARKGRAKGITDIPYVGLRGAIDFAKQHFEAGYRAMRHGSDRLLTIHYEQLVLNPKEETKRICAFFGIDWSDEMLRPGQKKHLGENVLNRERATPWYDKKSYYRDPQTKEINKWQGALTPAEQVRITKAFMVWEFTGELSKLGYDLSLEHLSFADKTAGTIKSLFRSLVGDLRLFMHRVFNRFF